MLFCLSYSYGGSAPPSKSNQPAAAAPDSYAAQSTSVPHSLTPEQGGFPSGRPHNDDGEGEADMEQDNESGSDEDQEEDDSEDVWLCIDMQSNH